MAEPRHPLLRRGWGRVLGIASVVLGLVMLGSAQLRMQYLLDRLDEEVALRTATQCVAAWDRTEQIRNANEFVYRRTATTLMALVGENPSPEAKALIERYRRQVESDVSEIRRTVASPDCDLKDAQATVGDTRR